MARARVRVDSGYEVVTGKKGRKFVQFSTERGRRIRIPEETEAKVCSFFEKNPNSDIYDANVATLVAPTLINAILAGTPSGRRICKKGLVRRPSTRGPAASWAQHVTGEVQTKGGELVVPSDVIPNLARDVSHPTLAANAQSLQQAQLKALRATMGSRGLSRLSIAKLEEVSVIHATVFTDFQRVLDESDDLREDHELQMQKLAAAAQQIENLRQQQAEARQQQDRILNAVTELQGGTAPEDANG
jgi:hypothetical protein